MKKETIKSDQDEPAKDPLTVKSILSLSKVLSVSIVKTYIGLIGLGSFIESSWVGLLVRLHLHHGRCVGLVRELKRISGNSLPHLEIVERGPITLYL